MGTFEELMDSDQGMGSVLIGDGTGGGSVVTYLGRGHGWTVYQRDGWCLTQHKQIVVVQGVDGDGDSYPAEWLTAECVACDLDGGGLWIIDGEKFETIPDEVHEAIHRCEAYPSDEEM